jgi:integrase
MSVEKVKDSLLERKKKKSARHYKTLKSRLGRFAKDFVCDIGAITTPQIQTWLDKQNFESEVTYHNYWSSINQLFRYATRQKHCMNNVADDVERVDIEHGEVGIYTPEEITKLLAAATPDFLPCMAIGAFAGIRSCEIERLDWSCVNWEAKEIFLEKKITKTKYSRAVPMHDNLIAWLADYRDAKGKVWKGLHDEYYERQAEIAKAAKIEWVHNGLRHSYGTYRCRVLNGNVTQVSNEMGNSKAVVENHYKRLVPANDATLYFAVLPSRPDNVVAMGATKK